MSRGRQDITGGYGTAKPCSEPSPPSFTVEGGPLRPSDCVPGQTEADWSRLSDDAKLMLAGHFSFGGRTTLTFQTPWNVSPRAMAALAEAVEAGPLSVKDGAEGLYARTYRPVEPFVGLSAWMQKNKAKAKGFIVMVPDADRLERPPASWPVPSGYKRHPK